MLHSQLQKCEFISKQTNKQKQSRLSVWTLNTLSLCCIQLTIGWYGEANHWILFLFTYYIASHTFLEWGFIVCSLSPAETWLPLPYSRGQYTLLQCVYFLPWLKTQKKKEGWGEGKRGQDPDITMATADSGVKPLQNAMKMAKVAIQLDGGSRHEVETVSCGDSRDVNRRRLWAG